MLKPLLLSASATTALVIFWQAATVPALAEPPGVPIVTSLNPAATQPTHLPGLHNVVQYTPNVISGGVPEGEEAFETLSRMGIKTVISVDGALPDLELAKKHNLRYVHLPIGYNGMDEARIADIARAVRDLPKPIYIHCHHGKHRSASATAASSVLLGWLTPEDALAKMKVSGTAESYTGLWDAVGTAQNCEADAIDNASTAFPEQWKPSDLVEAMVEIDEANDRLKLIEKAGWATPKDHPDLVPAAEAGTLADHFRLLREDPDTSSRPADYRERLDRDQILFSEIEQGLLAKMPGETVSAKFKLTQQSCKSCHAEYRDKAGLLPRRLEGN